MIIHQRVNRWGKVVPSFQVDENFADAVAAHKWFLHSKGYLVAKTKGKQVYLHRLVWGIAYGDCPQIIDHINQDKLDNRLCNLREATNSRNILNSGSRKKKSDLPMGVSLDRRRSKYLAQIVIDGRYRFLGYFLTPEEAEAAYLAAKSAVLGIS
jgi:hypothetical protein